MSRFDFVSPGAAFTGEMTKLLAERKAEERQRLLDSLAQNADSRAAQQLERESAESKQRMASQQQQDELARLGAVTSNLDIGADPEAAGVSPEMIALGKKYGAWHDVPEPQVNTAITGMQDDQGQAPTDFTPADATPPAPKTHLGYVGSAQQRDRERKRAQTGAIISSLMQDPQKKQVGEFLANVAAANDGVLSDQALSYLAPDTNVKIFDEPSGKFKDGGSIPANSHVVTRGYAPSQASMRDRFIGSDISGHPVSINSDGSYKVDQNVQLKTGAEENSIGIPQRLIEDHNTRVSLLSPDDNGIVDPNDMRVFRQSGFSIIQAANRVSPMVRQLATEFLNNPAAYAQHLTKVQLDDREISQLEQLKNAIASPEVAELLKRNPVKALPKPPAAPGAPSTQTNPNGLTPLQIQMMDRVK